MKLLNGLFIITFVLTFFLSQPKLVDANTNLQSPLFPSCTNPTGILKAKYENGIHGIVGENGTFTGSDNVYQIADDAVTQCFCATDGRGIQTNWWKIAEMSESEVNEYKLKGWNYIPDGFVWNLQQSSYLAKNEAFSCKSSNSTNNSADDKVAGAFSSPNSFTTSVLSLATTGNIISIYLLLTAGLSTFALGIYFLQKSKH